MERLWVTPTSLRVAISLITVIAFDLQVWPQGVFLLEEFSWFAKKTLAGLVLDKFVILYAIDVGRSNPNLFLRLRNHSQVPGKLLLTVMSPEYSLRLFPVLRHHLLLILLVEPNLEYLVEAYENISCLMLNKNALCVWNWFVLTHHAITVSLPHINVQWSLLLCWFLFFFILIGL